jgi:four helix bundle protein
MESYRELVVWQKSCALALAIYQTTSAFPRSELFGLTSQLRRAGVSVPTNIAEGYCRQTRADYLRFLSIAQGSVGEVETLLYLSHALSYLDEARAQELTGLATEVSRMLTRLTQRLRASAPSPRPLAPGP